MNSPSAFPSNTPALPDGQEIVQDLCSHLDLCQEILSIVERENHSLRVAAAGRQFELHHSKKNLLPKLNLSLDKIRQHRIGWQRLGAQERSRFTEIPPLLRQNQDLIMKIIFLDRENEQILLRRGLVPTAHLPPANRQRPHYVADLYRRGGAPP